MQPTSPKPNQRPTSTNPNQRPTSTAQSNSAAKVAAGPAFIRGKRGAAVAPASFPSRGATLSSTAIRAAAAKRLVDIDDAGDEAELVDFWTNDLGRTASGKLAAIGGKIEASEEGELRAVAREGAEDDGMEVMELLSGVTDLDLEDLVDALLGEEVRG